MVPVTKKDWRHAGKRIKMAPGCVRQLLPILQKIIIRLIPSCMEAKPHSEKWPLWEVFIRARQGLDHKHVGSLYAADAGMAIENARDVYTRRNEGISIWVVENKNVHASSPDDAGEFFDPANDKMYRHPGFYHLPDQVKNI